MTLGAALFLLRWLKEPPVTDDYHEDTKCTKEGIEQTGFSSCLRGGLYLFFYRVERAATHSIAWTTRAVLSKEALSSA